MAQQRIKPAQIEPSGTDGDTLTTVAGVTAWAAGGGGGSSALDDLTDVVITAPASGEGLIYDGTNWVNDTVGAGSLDLDDLGDVVITSPSTNDVLLFDGTNWVNDTAPGGGGGAPITAEYVTTASDGTLSAEVVIPGMVASPDRAGAGGAGTSEEYDTSTTGLTWSPSSPATVDSDTTVQSHLYIKTTDAIGERLGLKAWAPSGAFDARAKLTMGFSTSVGGGGSFGLCISSSGNTSRALCTLDLGSGMFQAVAYTYAGGSYTQRGSIWTSVGNVLYVRITRDASNNVTFYFSNDGIAWQVIATLSFTFTVANIGYRLYCGMASTTSEYMADWLRTDV